MSLARILIDSSVWIEYYRPGGPQVVREAVGGVLTQDRVVTTGLIVVEVLQGAKTETDYVTLQQDFWALPWLDLTRGAAKQAARWGFDLYRRGTPVPPTDLAIAAVAHLHQCELWHLDAHFDRIQQLAPLVTRRPGHDGQSSPLRG